MWAVPMASVVSCALICRDDCDVSFGDSLEKTDRVVIQASYLICSVNAYPQHSPTMESDLHADQNFLRLRFSLGYSPALSES